MSRIRFLFYCFVLWRANGPILSLRFRMPVCCLPHPGKGALRFQKLAGGVSLLSLLCHECLFWCVRWWLGRWSGGGGSGGGTCQALPIQLRLLRSPAGAFTARPGALPRLRLPRLLQDANRAAGTVRSALRPAKNCGRGPARPPPPHTHTHTNTQR